MGVLTKQQRESLLRDFSEGRHLTGRGMATLAERYGISRERVRQFRQRFDAHGSLDPARQPVPTVAWDEFKTFSLEGAEHRVLGLQRVCGDWVVERHRRAIKYGRVHGEWIPERPMRYAIVATENAARMIARDLLREVGEGMTDRAGRKLGRYVHVEETHR